MKKFLLSLFLSSLYFFLVAQPTVERLERPKKVICYSESVSKGTRIYPRLKASNNAKTQAANIIVTYNGFTPEAEAAFQAAVDIWAGLISSPVTIRIDATWQALQSGVLGSAIWGSAYRGFEGAKEMDTWYPVALAEKMAGRDLNDPSEPDIVANFSNTADWYLGTDGNPGPTEFDLVSVVLHEIGHGLGFVDSFGFDDSSGDNNGFYGLDTPPFPFIFDLSVKNTSGLFLTSIIGPGEPSIDLGGQLISNQILFESSTAKKVTGADPRLFAPGVWDNGSSIAHLNEASYPSGNINSLMTPQIGMNEVMQDPGPITLNMLGDMGWDYTYLVHDRVPNTEDFSAPMYTVTTTIDSDSDYDPNSVTLYYSHNAFSVDTIVVTMMPTGNPDEYSADIPSTSQQGQLYSYYLSVLDTNDREFRKPSFAPEFFYTFTTDTDMDAPVIEHTKPGFIRNTDTELILEANVRDFLPLASVDVEYFINDQAAQTASFVLVDEFDSLYRAVIDISGAGLQEGDSIRYSITAVDQSANSNMATFPQTGLIKLDVFALSPAVAKYSNNFDNAATASLDFFASNNFRIETPAGFSNAAIHSDHPYSDGTGPNDESNYTYELKIPIILSANDAFISFDEVVLVEPGESGTAFGNPEFWDYVIVEGSNDGGSTWQPIGPGYDSRANSAWLSTYNNSITDNASNGIGDESLYVNRVIDILASSSFMAGEEVLFRFRLFADQAAHGWGWAIDNLKIQIDDTAPVIKHNHLDYITSNDNLLLSALVTDNFLVDSVAFVFQVNDQPLQTAGFPGNANEYNLDLSISAVNPGDTIKYQIVAFDDADPVNVSYLPGENEFFIVPYIQFGTPVVSYANNFNTPNTDFVGNFFTVSTESGFSDGAITTRHPYPEGFGTNNSSDFTFTLKTPITVSASQHYLAYDEVLLSALNSDVALLEASKDAGATWITLEDYSSTSESQWAAAVNDGSDGNESLYINRIVDLLSTGNIAAGDQILLRFRLNSKADTNAWGWAIDNLEVQTDQITSLPESLSGLEIRLFPNPIESEELTIRINAQEIVKHAEVTIVNSNAQTVRQTTLNEINAGEYASKIDLATLPKGLYLVKISLDGQSIARRIIKL